MPQPTSRRTVVAAALAAPFIAAGSARAQEGTLTTADVEAIVRAFYEPFNTGDTSIYDTVLAEDWADHPLGMGQQPGREGFKPVIELFRGIFPDLQVTNEDIIISGDKAAVRSTIRGTHEGNLFGIPGTGTPLEFMAIDVHRLENGMIAETWHVEDFLSVLFQLGVTFQPAASAEGTPSA